MWVVWLLKIFEIGVQEVQIWGNRKGEMELLLCMGSWILRWCLCQSSFSRITSAFAIEL